MNPANHTIDANQHYIDWMHYMLWQMKLVEQYELWLGAKS
jgi:hypothetical protein